MRCDMGGSAVVMGVFHALQALAPNIEVHGAIGAAENMCAADSFKLGDISRTATGKLLRSTTQMQKDAWYADCLCLASSWVQITS